MIKTEQRSETKHKNTKPRLGGFFIHHLPFTIYHCRNCCRRRSCSRRRRAARLSSGEDVSIVLDVSSGVATLAEVVGGVEMLADVSGGAEVRLRARSRAVNRGCTELAVAV